MKVIITGSTGMIGKGVLLECLESSLVTEVLLVNRTPIAIQHPKIKEIICKDWFDLTPYDTQLMGYDACFFCLGATLTTLSEAEFRRINYDLTLHFVDTLLKKNTDMTVCYVSGMGIDGTKPSKTMWLRIKGETEQALLQRTPKKAFMFRPGYIQPMKGTRSKTWPYRLFYRLFSWSYPIIRRLFPTFVTSTVSIGRAMIAVAQTPYNTPFLENEDINRLAAK